MRYATAGLQLRLPLATRRWARAPAVVPPRLAGARTIGIVPAMSADATTPETAVRRYLQFLADPTALRDEERLEELRAAAERASDPIERLRAYSEIERAEQVDGSALEADFVAAAKSFADAEGISPGAFRRLGVPIDVLVRAGLLSRASGGRDTRAATARPSRSTGARATRAPSVGADTIKAFIRDNVHGRFTLADVQGDVGGSPLTVRKAVDELVSVGEVRRLGPRQGHQGPGRAPIEYERA